MPLWAARVLVATLALAAAAGLIGSVVTVVMNLTTPEPVTTIVRDGLAEVSYTLPDGWREGAVSPVTAFTSVAAGGRAMVMVRSGPDPKDEKLADLATDLADLYSRVLLHGDTVDVVEDRPVKVAGYDGHSRALRAEYTDVVNRPVYLRVVVADRGGTTIVLLAVSQPDDARARADIESIVRTITR